MRIRGHQKGDCNTGGPLGGNRPVEVCRTDFGSSPTKTYGQPTANVSSVEWEGHTMSKVIVTCTYSATS